MRDRGLAEVSNPTSVPRQRVGPTTGTPRSWACEAPTLLVDGRSVAVCAAQLCQARGAPPHCIGITVCTQIWRLLEKAPGLPLSRFDCLSRRGRRPRCGEPAADLGVARRVVTSFRDLDLAGRHRSGWANWAWAGSCGRSASWSCVCRRRPPGFRPCRVPRGVAGGKLRLKLGLELLEAGTVGGGLGAARGLDSSGRSSHLRKSLRLRS